MIKLNYEIIDVKQEEKEKLYKLLQYALYDGSQYIENDKAIGLIMGTISPYEKYDYLD